MDKPDVGSIGPSLLRYALIGTVLLILSSPVQAQVFGRTDPGLTPTAGLFANFKRGSRFTLAEPGIVHTLCAFLDSNGGSSGTQQIRMALYRDQNGTPSTEVVESDTHAFSAQQIPARVVCFPTGFVPIPPGNYWIMIHTAGTAGVLRAFQDGPANWHGGADTFSDGTSNIFGPGNAGSGTLTVSAQYFQESTMRAVGRATIGSTPSRGMTGNFKRGSSFELTEQGRLEGFSTYLDGFGAASSSSGQAFRIVLYRDADGVPGDRVAETGRTALLNGALPTWRSHDSPPVLLEPGRYWMVLHTAALFGGLTNGIIRNYGGDGTVNWYGNADDFEDGAAESFGPGTPGNGTISGLMLYEPGPFTLERLGRTDIGTTPSRGMTANMLRASRFFLPLDDVGVVHALYAYLDGNGGVAGSQQIRMVMYDGFRFGDLLAQSDVVTLVAGTPPGWVRFPVPPTVFTGGVYIAIHTGNTGGVARNYGGDAGDNWLGKPDNFADGPDGTLTNPVDPLPTRGAGTLSVYAEYSIRRP